MVPCVLLIQALEALQELVDQCAAQARNYKTMAEYYRKCMSAGVVTKRSAQRREGDDWCSSNFIVVSVHIN